MLLPIGIIIFAGVICYTNALFNGFVWDDRALVLENTYIKDFKHISYIATKNLYDGREGGQKTNFYRPLQGILLLLSYQLFGTNPFGYHFINIFIHIVNAILIYLFVFALFKKRTAAFLSGLIFVVHPINTEAVTYVSGIADPLATLFILLSFLSFIKFANNPKSQWYYLKSMILFLLAILSKESSVIYPFILLCYVYLFISEKKIDMLKRTLFFFVLIAAYLVIRYFLDIKSAEHVIANANFFSRLLTFFIVFVKYIYLLIIPVPLHMERIMTYVNSFWNLRVLPSIVIFIVFLFLVFKTFTKFRKISFGLLWFLIALIPVLNIFIPLNAQMAEHWLYLPSIGIFMSLSLIVDQFLAMTNNRKRRICYYGIFCLMIFYSFLTIRQNQQWKNERTFYNYTLKYSPRSAKTYYNIGGLYKLDGKLNDAINEYKKALDVNPCYVEAINNLGNVYRIEGKLNDAVNEYNKAIAIDPRYIEAINNLGNTYAEMGNDDKAIEEFKKSIDVQPNYIAFNSLGLSYYAKKQWDIAIEQYKKAIEINSLSSKPYINLGNAHYAKGDINNAVLAWERALKLDPSNSVIATNLKLLKRVQNIQGDHQHKNISK
jgi:tetratricopeptide (TPR) repeat protein